MAISAPMVAPEIWSVVNRCSQMVDASLYLKREDGVICDGWKETLGFHGGGEIGDVGSLAAGRVSEGGWPCVWHALVVDLRPSIAAWRDPSGAASSIEVGIDAVGARDDIERDCGTTIGTVGG